jgi:hypothetical protein
VITGDKLGYFGYVALTTNLAAARRDSAGFLSAWAICGSPTCR